MAEKTRVSVITPVWNQSQHTARFVLQARQGYQNDSSVEFIVIDNGSRDNTPALLKTYALSNLRVLTNPENLGFPIACNQGAREARGDILLFLNNDIITFGDYVSEVRRVMADNPSTALRTGLIAGPELNTHNTGWNQFGPLRVAYIAGWCLAITRATFEQAGGFDERYSPADYEDMDLCYTVTQKLGGSLLRLNLPIRHISGQTGQQLGNRLAITETNRLKFAEKWDLSLEDRHHYQVAERSA